MNPIHLTIIGVLSVSSILFGEELTDTRFAEIHESLRPSSKELWRTIPWKISLIEAQNTASKEGKPIFIWAMDGHPLGCT